MRPGAVPETLLRLAVEGVRRPAGVARHVERQRDHPRRRLLVSSSRPQALSAKTTHVAAIIAKQVRRANRRR